MKRPLPAETARRSPAFNIRYLNIRYMNETALIQKPSRKGFSMAEKERRSHPPPVRLNARGTGEAKGYAPNQSRKTGKRKGRRTKERNGKEDIPTTQGVSSFLDSILFVGV
ncbi:hypothetical protein B4135_0769 [Caldibacillus debilis]|uniref:Uncharacterized protein n=1 Tax=Caldibacillus debilis TaxID=301148 RepID=A0A150M5J0_9BACI|nr:hypothetical protein B4135_0769 [Caldibacillus debilis]